MADDLVAELTLRLQNQISGGLDEIRGDFLQFDSTLKDLTGVLGELNATLAELRAPAQLSEGMQTILNETGQLTAEVGAMQVEMAALTLPPSLSFAAVAGSATDAAAAVAAIGSEIDGDITKIEAMKAAWGGGLDGAGGYGFANTFGAPAPGDAGDSGAPAFLPPGTDAAAASFAAFHAAQGGYGFDNTFGAPAAGDAGDSGAPAFLPPGTDATAASFAAFRAAQLPYGFENTYAPPQAGYDNDPYRPAFLPPETPMPGSAQDDDNGDHPAVHGGMGMLNEAFFGLIGADMAEHMAKGFADYDWTLTHIAITEKLSGAAAEAEKNYLGDQLQQLALQTGNSSSDLADAYYFLVTTGMNRNLIQQLMPALAQTSTAYNVPVTDQAQAVFTLNDVLGIPPDEMEQALGIIAYAAKLGHFGVADFGANLPGVGAQMKMLGDGGLPGEVTAASALEIVRRVTGTSDEAATDVSDLLSYMTSPIAARFFDRTKRSQDLLGAPIMDLMDKYHIKLLNLPEYFNDEREKGVDPLDAMVDYMHTIGVNKMSPTDQMFVFGSLFHNQQAARAMLGLEENYDDFKVDETTLGNVNPATVHTDSQTAMSAPEFSLRQLGENFVQLSREIGSDLIPTFELLDVILMDFGVGLRTLQTAWDIATKPLTTGLGTTAAYAGHEIDLYPGGAQRSRFGFNDGLSAQPLSTPPAPPAAPAAPSMALDIRVTHQGNVQVTPRNVPPGTSVVVNQGPVLNVP